MPIFQIVGHAIRLRRNLEGLSEALKFDGVAKEPEQHQQDQRAKQHRLTEWGSALISGKCRKKMVENRTPPNRKAMRAAKENR